MGKAIVISGTPGTGKTTISKILSKELNAPHLNLSSLAFEKGFVEKKDPNRNTYLIDEEGLRKYVEEFIRKTEGLVIIDSHYGEFLDDALILKIFVLRLNPSVLLRRLISKGYNPRKVKENLEAELVGSCTFNAISTHPKEKVCEIDTTGKNTQEVVREIVEVLRGTGKCIVGIDWTQQELTDDVVRFITTDP